MNKQITYERKNRKNNLPEALITNREKEIKEEPIRKMERFGTRPNKTGTSKVGAISKAQEVQSFLNMLRTYS